MKHDARTKETSLTKILGQVGKLWNLFGCMIGMNYVS